MEISEIIDGLSYNERKLLIALDGLGGSASPADVVKSGDFGLEVEVMGAASWLSVKGLATVEERTEKFFELSDAAAVGKGLPERRSLNIISSSGGKLDMEALSLQPPDSYLILAVGHFLRKGLHIQLPSG